MEPARKTVEVNVSSDRLRLVVAVSNLTADSDNVVRYAAQIALQTQARLRVVHPFGVIGDTLRNVLFSVPSLDQRIRIASADLIEQAARITAGMAVSYETVLDHNRPEQVLIKQAIYGLADIVVASAAGGAEPISLQALAGVRTPCLFVPADMEPTSRRLVVQALTPRVTPDAFLRAQRWMRILRSLPLHDSAFSVDTLELDVLLCPEPGSCAQSSQLQAADALRRALGESAPAIIAGLIDAEGPPQEQEFSQALHAMLLAEAPCPVLYMPPLAAIRSVPDPLPA